ncbi:hypothetical protein DFH07DRAFT_1023379 [Mycena maculata]|uniref:Uncharacterized protein n=1 Tax=Mycena maculata TaxID=230809 RepID=A0AAD7JBP5_9AGAR|nr:hypothetical protein DFH07DRAFT_1023379 [Mycena maculata]
MALLMERFRGGESGAVTVALRCLFESTAQGSRELHERAILDLSCRKSRQVGRRFERGSIQETLQSVENAKLDFVSTGDSRTIRFSKGTGHLPDPAFKGRPRNTVSNWRKVGEFGGRMGGENPARSECIRVRQVKVCGVFWMSQKSHENILLCIQAAQHRKNAKCQPAVDDGETRDSGEESEKSAEYRCDCRIWTSVERQRPFLLNALEVETTLFRVYHVPFYDTFAIPQPPTQGAYEACPLVVLHHSARGFKKNWLENELEKHKFSKAEKFSLTESNNLGVAEAVVERSGLGNTFSYAERIWRLPTAASGHLFSAAPKLLFRLDPKQVFLATVLATLYHIFLRTLSDFQARHYVGLGAQTRLPRHPVLTNTPPGGRGADVRDYLRMDRVTSVPTVGATSQGCKNAMGDRRGN